MLIQSIHNMSTESKLEKILLLYFSGSGSTQTISEILKYKLETLNYKVDSVDLDIKTKPEIIEKYDFILLGTPTYHCYPPKTVSEFINKIKPQNNSKKIFLFATYGLYPGNNLRTIAKKLLDKKIQTIGYTGFRGPASDGTLLLPSWIKFMYNYEKDIKIKTNYTVKQIELLYKDKKPKTKIPFYKWYAPLDWIPNKFFASRKFHKEYVPNIRVILERWTGEKIDCPRFCWNNSTKPPKYNKKNCEFCLRCVHRTQNKAVFFSEKMKDKERCNKIFYKKLKTEILG